MRGSRRGGEEKGERKERTGREEKEKGERGRRGKRREGKRERGRDGERGTERRENKNGKDIEENMKAKWREGEMEKRKVKVVTWGKEKKGDGREGEGDPIAYSTCYYHNTHY